MTREVNNKLHVLQQQKCPQNVPIFLDQRDKRAVAEEKQSLIPMAGGRRGGDVDFTK